MKARNAIFLTLFAILFAQNAYSQKAIVGSIQTFKIDSTQEVSFEGVISFTSDTVAIEYWKPGRSNRSKILYLTVKNRKEFPGSITFLFNNYEHRELFTNGQLTYDEARQSFAFKAWNEYRTFAYSGKLL